MPVGGYIVFAFGVLIVIAVVTAAGVWWGKWKARQWMRKAERDSAPKPRDR